MASRIMHLAVAKLITESFPITDAEAFYLGNLAPDLSKYGNGNYEVAHFGATCGNMKGIDFVAFSKKYNEALRHSDFALGYYVHLLTDAIWLRTIQQTYVRQYPERKQALYKLGYTDMKHYNAVLIDQFALKTVKHTQANQLIEEIDTTHFNDLLAYLDQDFMCKNDSECVFQVYPYEAVIQFIHESVREAINYMTALKKSQTIDAAKAYFVPV